MTNLDPRRAVHTDAAPPVPEEEHPGIVFLGGAIKWWWLARCTGCGAIDEPHLLLRERCPASDRIYGEHQHIPDEFWDTPAHREYVAWRNDVRKALIDAGYLTYAPHEAFKGTWHEGAQAINDAAIQTSHVFLNLSPAEAFHGEKALAVITEGTDEEMDVAREAGVPILWAEPGIDGGVEKVVYMVEGVIRGY